MTGNFIRYGFIIPYFWKKVNYFSAICAHSCRQGGKGKHFAPFRRNKGALADAPAGQPKSHRRPFAGLAKTPSPRGPFRANFPPFDKSVYFLPRAHRYTVPQNAAHPAGAGRRAEQGARGMDYVKKLCILKQVSSGFAAGTGQVSAILTAETFGGRLQLSLSPIGLAPLSAGRYRCLVADARGNSEVLDLPSPPAGAALRKVSPLSIAEGLFAALCYVRGRAVPVACGSCGGKAYDAAALCAALDEDAADTGKKALREDTAGAGKTSQNEAAGKTAAGENAGKASPREAAGKAARPAEEAAPAPAREAGAAQGQTAPAREAGAARAAANAARATGTAQKQAAPPPRKGAQTAPPPAQTDTALREATPEREADGRYDDELIAAENYYAFADADLSSLRIRPSAGRADAEEPPVKAEAGEGGEGGNGPSFPPNTESGTGEGGEGEQAAERASSEPKKPPAEQPPRYYAKVQGDLRALFEQYPPEEELAACIPYSRWAKIAFARGKHYAVGVISDEGRPQYICYGVPAERLSEPPKALRGFCSFMPLSVFDLHGKGYWMMFQDADTGECIQI